MLFDIKKVKICVFVPENSLDDVRNAVCRAGAGVIGNYSYCTSASKTTGTFLPNDKANPAIGESGKLEVLSENKLEFICETEKVKSVILELRKAHPYEEPEIDIFPLLDENDFK